MINKTTHKIVYNDSRNLNCVGDKTINLIVTSPPYPMIEMWDKTFSYMNNDINNVINGIDKFNLMHLELNKVWDECDRVLKDGGFIIINIGDATRTINNQFQLYSNHTRITEYFINLNYEVLPLIIWKKTANSPNKFMGSGMLPCGAYITLEHEYILIFRKRKRDFNSQNEKDNRQKSAYFYEERNVWFNDIWDLKGVKQDMNNDKTRKRSGAYATELPYRIINMFSCKGDFVLDPFLGTGTTILASMISERNSIGVELDNYLNETIHNKLLEAKKESKILINSRINKHNNYISEYKKKKNIDKTKYYNDILNCDVITSQEQKIEFNVISNVIFNENIYEVNYEKYVAKIDLFQEYPHMLALG